MVYAGIGSRETPQEVLDIFQEIAKELALKKFILRSGGADGADSAFERGCDEVKGDKEIYLPWKNFNGNKSELYTPTKEAFLVSSKYHLRWSYLKQGVKNLHARNVHQILGKDLNNPVDFVICWTKGSGGTMQTLRIAMGYKEKVIPIYNFLVKQYNLNDILKESNL